MNLSEEMLILKIKSRIFENIHIHLKIDEDQLTLEEHIQTLMVIIRDELAFECVHFFVYKEFLKDYQHVFLSYITKSISVLNEGEKGRVSYPTDQYLIDPPFPVNNCNKGLLLKDGSGSEFGLMLFTCNGQVPRFSVYFWRNLSDTIYRYIFKTIELLTVLSEKRRYEKLQRVTNQFYSSMDMDKVLGEVIQSLKDMYPSFTYQLLLSNYYSRDARLPIQFLDYTEQDSAVMEAFVTGEFRMEDDRKEKRSLLYFPLKGKQGVYGVLQITANESIMIAQHDIEFISILAQTASSAIENAHLYQQSKKRIEDLRLVTKVSQQLNSNLRLSDIVDYIVHEVKQSFQAHEVGFILKKQERTVVLPGSTDYFFKGESEDFQRFVERFFQTEKDSLFIGNFNQTHLLKNFPYNSVMAEPLREDGTIIGFAICLHEKPYHFSFDSFKLYQSLAHHSSLAFSNALLREELERLVITDYLTKLYSRNFLDDYLKESMEKDCCGAFLLFDIDNFKLVNDTYGHQVGDEVLKQIAGIIMANIQSDGIGARWGGEEIVIYLPNRSPDEGLRIAERLVILTEMETNPRVTISCGVSHWTKGRGDHPFHLFKRADEALYVAKSRGKNQAVASE